MFRQLILIAIILVFIIDLSGVIETIKRKIILYLTRGKLSKTTYSFKPFDCSLCMTHHIGLIYMICVGQFSLLNYAILCIISFLTPVIYNLLLLIRDILNKFINYVNEKAI